MAALTTRVQALSAYSYGALGWLSLKALPLITWPTFITVMLGSEGQRGHSTLLLEVVRSDTTPI